MILGRFSVRGVLLLYGGGLCMLVLAGGVMFAFIESIGTLAGVWMAFNVLSTTGFQWGPATPAGQLMAIGLFMIGITCWFGILVAAMEICGLRMRKHMLLDEALRPLARRPKNRLFHVN